MTTATVQAFANIAFTKYRGNHDNALRLPANGSISMNLEGLYTRTTVSVRNVAPDVDFFYDPFDPHAGETIAFTGFFFDPGELDTHTITWNFGDGSDPVTGQGLEVTHVYQQPGTYEVTLTIADDDGSQGVASATLTLAEPPTPTPTPTDASTPTYMPTETPTPTDTPTETPTPTATFTPFESIQALQSSVEVYVASGQIAQQMRNPLVSKLQNAANSLANGQTNAAINQLNAFINQVQAQRGKKISEAATDDLISQAEAIIARLGATPTPAPTAG